jgi:hypothetical protein
MHHMVAHCDDTWQTVAGQSNVNLLGGAVGTLAGYCAPRHIRSAWVIRLTAARIRGLQ